MRRATYSLVIAGLLACAGTQATARNVSPAAQPDKAGAAAHKPVSPTQLSTAAIDRSKEADYKAAKAKAQKEYKSSAAKCRKRSTKAIPGCMADARAVRDEALAEAKTRWGTPQ